jgi:hypothetical protein
MKSNNIQQLLSTYQIGYNEVKSIYAKIYIVVE